MPAVRVRCDPCGEWVETEIQRDGTVECNCGSVFAVTVTRIRPARSEEASV